MIQAIEFFKKEIIEYIRNWKTWVVLLVLPIIIFPLGLVGPVLIGENSGEDDDDFSVYIENEANDSIALELIETSDQFSITENSDEYDIRVDENQQNQIDVYYDENSSDSLSAFNALSDMVTSYSNENMQNVLMDNNIDPSDMIISLNPSDESSDSERGGDLMNYFLPIGISLMVVMGGMAHGSSSIAGEKERNTIESLLALPFPRYNIILVKYLAVLISNIKMVIAAIIGAIISIVLIEHYTELVVDISINHILYILFISSIASMLFSGLHMLASTFSSNIKESQSNSTILSVVALVLMIGSQLLLDNEWWNYIIPGVNYYILMSETFPFNIDGEKLAYVVLSNVVISVIVIITISFIMKKEKFSFKN